MRQKGPHEILGPGIKKALMGIQAKCFVRFIDIEVLQTSHVGIRLSESKLIAHAYLTLHAPHFRLNLGLYDSININYLMTPNKDPDGKIRRILWINFLQIKRQMIITQVRMARAV